MRARVGAMHERWGYDESEGIVQCMRVRAGVVHASEGRGHENAIRCHESDGQCCACDRGPGS